MDFSRFLARFPEVQEDPGGYLVPCPAHDDRRPSLFLTLKDDGRLLVFCRAGCEQADILEKLGLKPRDLFGWMPGTAHVVTGGTTLPGPGSVDVAALRVWLDATTARYALPGYAHVANVALEYARSRFGLDAAAVERLGLGVSPRGARDPFAYLSPRFRAHARLVVPLYGVDGVARGAQGRDLSGECSARWVSLANRRNSDDAHPIAWAKFGVLRGGADYGVYVVTEGPSDGLTVAAVGYDALMVRGAGIAANTAMVDEIANGLRGHPVVIAGDDDTSGRKFTETLGAALRERGVPASRLTIPNAGDDLTDWRARDPEGFPAALHRAVRDATPIEPAEGAGKPVLRGRVVRQGAGEDIVSVIDGNRAGGILDDLTATYGESDAMRAHALVEYCGGRIKYAPGLGFWTWNGRVWEPGETRVRQAIHAMGAALMLAGRTREARWYGTTIRIDALITELRAVPSVAVHADAFDARPELLTFRNGTVDLRSGDIRPPDMRDMLTRFVDVDFDPSAIAPRWERFVREIFPANPDLADYLRRLIGYGITGDTSEQCFVVLWGKGANGKSVLTDTITHVFRDIAKTTPFATFEERPSGGIPNDLAALRGARLVMASEGESGKQMAEAVLKRVTGADMISARFLRQEFFEFKPAFLLLLATNHKPRFKGQDDGLWRRVKLLQFSRYFAPAERDHNLTATLKDEAPGIIAWAVRGAVEWYRDGLQDPDVIREATREYRETSDPLAGFFPGVIVPDPDGRILGNEAFGAYLEWCEAENLPGKERWTRRGFYSAMEERGAVRHSVSKGVELVGVRIAANTPGPGGGNDAVSARIFER